MTLPPAIAAVAPDGRLTPVMRRRILIDIARRRIQPGTGRAPEFLLMRNWPRCAESLPVTRPMICLT
jgi:hypothetical protein